MVGGRTEFGFWMGEYIQKNNIDVDVALQCDSACAIAAIHSETIGGEGVLGFHLPYIKGGKGDPTSPFYVLAVESNNMYKNETVKVLRNNKYISNELLIKIIEESSSDNFIDVNVKDLNF